MEWVTRLIKGERAFVVLGFEKDCFVAVDVENGQVLLMFEAWQPTASPGTPTTQQRMAPAYRGSDLMVFDKSGLVDRIVTLNHTDQHVYSPALAHL